MRPFFIERYFAQHEFTAKHMLSSSDCDSLSMHTLVAQADSELQHLWNNLSLGYTESPGHPLLRAEISKLHTAITPNKVLVVTPVEGIFLALGSIIKSNDHVITALKCEKTLRHFDA